MTYSWFAPILCVGVAIKEQTASTKKSPEHRCVERPIGHHCLCNWLLLAKVVMPKGTVSLTLLCGLKKFSFESESSIESWRAFTPADCGLTPTGQWLSQSLREIDRQFWTRVICIPCCPFHCLEIAFANIWHFANTIFWCIGLTKLLSQGLFLLPWKPIELLPVCRWLSGRGTGQVISGNSRRTQTF